MSDIPNIALSVRQPWAWAIVHAGKDVENRDWPTRFRGEVCIHASKGMGKAEYQDASETITSILRYTPDDQWLWRWHGLCAAPYKLERGGIIGVAEIVDCVEQSDSPWFFGRYGFVLRNARPVPLIPVSGALGFFDWRARVAA